MMVEICVILKNVIKNKFVCFNIDWLVFFKLVLLKDLLN